MDSILLQLAISLSGIDVDYLQSQECDVRPELMGAYIPKKDQVILCVNNIEREGTDESIVLRHELLHAVHTNLGIDGSFFPEPILTDIVRENLESEETLSVVLSYPEEQVDQELEVRFLDHTMTDWQVAFALIISRFVELLSSLWSH